MRTGSAVRRRLSVVAAAACVASVGVGIGAVSAATTTSTAPPTVLPTTTTVPVVPTLSVDPAVVYPGDTFTARGICDAPFAVLALSMPGSDDSIVVSFGRADDAGHFSVALTVPSTLAPGTYRVTGGCSQAPHVPGHSSGLPAVVLTVVATPAPPAPEHLPHTL